MSQDALQEKINFLSLNRQSRKRLLYGFPA